MCLAPQGCPRVSVALVEVLSQVLIGVAIARRRKAGEAGEAAPISAESSSGEPIEAVSTSGELTEPRPSSGEPPAASPT